MSEPWAVTAADEARHAATDDELWNESYYMDFVADDGSIGGYVRLGYYPNLGTTWWTTAVVRPDGPSILSMAFDLAAAAGGEPAAAGPSARVSIGVPAPLHALSVSARAGATALEDPSGVYRGEHGRPVELGIDLTWATDGTPYHYLVTTRYEIPCLVEGELRLNGEVVAVRGQGQRDHSWGVRDWWSFGWCWLACRLEDGTRIHATDVRSHGPRPALGYLQPPGGPVTPLTALSVSEVLGPEGLPDRAEVALDPGDLRMVVRPTGFGPVLLTAPDGRTSRFPRAMARVTVADGRTGSGWIEWNQPRPAATGR